MLKQYKNKLINKMKNKKKLMNLKKQKVYLIHNQKDLSKCRKCLKKVIFRNKDINRFLKH